MTPALCVLAVAPALAHPLSGTWTIEGSEAAVRARMDTAVDEAAAQLNFLIRELGRSKLRTAAKVCSAYTFVVGESRWVSQCDAGRRYERPLSGEHKTTDADGDPVTSHLTLAGDGATLAWLGESGGRRNQFKVQGDTLVLSARIESGSLDKPMQWQLEYRRAAE